VTWIVNRAINPVLQPVLKALGVNDLLDRFSKSLQKLVGIDAVKDALQTQLNNLLSNITLQLGSLETVGADETGTLFKSIGNVRPPCLE
jgi:hypothetical protein